MEGSQAGKEHEDEGRTQERATDNDARRKLATVGARVGCDRSGVEPIPRAFPWVSSTRYRARCYVRGVLPAM